MFGFKSDMTVVYTEANPHMKTPQWHVGVLNVPDSHPNVVLYSPRQAERDFNAMGLDIYQREQKATPANQLKTPKSLWWFLGTGLVTAGFFLVKYLMKK